MEAKYRPRRAWSRRGLCAVLGVTAVLVVAATSPAQGQVNLGTAESFAVLANTTITNTGSTTISGNVGLYPGTSVTGFTDVTLNGTLHVTDAVAQQALIDAGTAYGVLQGQTPCTDLTGQVLGQDVGTAADPLLPGVYCFSSSAQLTGDLYLSGGGEYIFQMGSTLTTASGSRVFLVDGAEACNVFWGVGTSATLGTSSEFVGTVIANVSITANTGAMIEGRLFALTGAVTLQGNTITRPVCATTTTTAPATTTTAAPATTTTAAPATTTTVAPATTTTAAPATTTTAAPATTTTAAPATTTTAAPATTTTAAPATTTTVAPATTTTAAPATTTTVAPATTTTAAGATTTTLAPGATTTSLAPGATTTVAPAGGATTSGTLARTGTARDNKVTAGLLALVLGGLMLLGPRPRSRTPIERHWSRATR